MEQAEVQAQREAAIQPKVDFVTANAREKAAKVAPEDLQREILAQAYIQNHLLTVSANNQSSITNHLMFYTIVMILSFVAGLLVALN